MGRPRKNGVKLSTMVPSKVLHDLKVKAAAINGSLGDAVCVLHAQYKTPEGETIRLTEELEAAKVAAEAALEVARVAARRAEKAEGRLARMSAFSKSQARHLPGWEE